MNDRFSFLLCKLLRSSRGTNPNHSSAEQPQAESKSSFKPPQAGKAAAEFRNDAAD
jgi:hypothetical protein